MEFPFFGSSSSGKTKEQEDAEEARRLAPYVKRSSEDTWGSLKAFARGVVGDASWGVSDLAEMGASAAVSRDLKQAAVKADEIRAAEIAHPYASAAGSMLLPAAAILSAVTTGGVLPLIAAGASGLGGLAKKVFSKKGAKALAAAAAREGVSEVGEAVSKRLVREAAGEGVEFGAKKLVSELAEEAGEKTVKEAVQGIAQRKARGEGLRRVGQVVTAPLRLATKAYKYTPAGVVDELAEKANKRLQKGLRAKLFKATGDQVGTQAGQTVLRELADGIAVKLPARAISAAFIELPMYSLGAAARESALSMDINAGAEYLSANAVNDFLSGGEMYGYFGLAESTLPSALRLAGKLLHTTAEYAPIFGRLKKVDLWTSEGAAKRTGVKIDTADWMYDNKEILNDAAEAWDEERYGPLFDIVRGLDANGAEYFVRNHSQILDAASKLPGAQSKEFVYRLRNLSEKQRSFMIQNIDTISDIETVKPGFSRAIGKLMDGNNGSLSVDAAQEVLKAARDVSLSSTSVADVAKNLFSKKAAQVNATEKLLQLAYARMSQDIGDIVSSFGQPGGPASAGAVIDGAHDLVDAAKAAISAAKESSKATGLKYSKSVMSKLDEAVAQYEQEIQRLVGRDTRKPLTAEEIIKQQSDMLKAKMDALARGEPDPTPEGFSFDALTQKIFSDDEALPTVDKLSAVASDLKPSEKVSGALVNELRLNAPQLEGLAMPEVAQLERTLDNKTAKKIHEAQSNFRSVIGEIVSYGRSSTYGAKPQFTKRFVRASGLADVVYGMARQTLQNPSVWGQAGAVRGAIDNVYSRFMSETGQYGSFRKNFMGKTSKSATAKKTRYEVDFDAVQKFVSGLGKTVNQEADAMTKGILSELSDILGQEVPYTPLASAFDSWNNMNEIMKDAVDVVSTHLSDLVESSDPKFSNWAGASSRSTGNQTEDFLSALSEINNRVVNESNSAVSRMRVSENIDSMIEKAKKYVDQDAAPELAPKGSLGPDLKPITPSSVLGPFNPYYAVSETYRALDAINKGLKARWQVAAQLKSMVQADRTARSFRNQLNKQTQILLRIAQRASADPQIVRFLQLAKKQQNGEMLTPEEEELLNLQQKEFEDIIGEEGMQRMQPPSQSEQETEDKLQKQFEEIISDTPEDQTPTQAGEDTSQGSIDFDRAEGTEQIKPASKKLPSADRDEQTIRIIQIAREFNSNPDALSSKMMESSDAVMGALPNIVSTSSGVMSRISSEIAKVAPKQTAPMLGKEQFTQQQLDRVRRVMALASNPHSIVSSITDGSLTQDDVDVLDRIYPSTAMEIRLAVQQVIEQCAKDGVSVPYQIQYAAERFLGIPVSSTTGVAIARSLQGVYSQGRQNGPGRPRQTMTPAMVANRSTGRVYGASNLGVANRLLTDKQRSETRNA